MEAEIGKLGNYVPYAVRMVSLAREGRVMEAMALYEKEAPSQYIKNWMSIEKSLKGLYMRSKGLELKYPLSSFNVPPALSQNLYYSGRPCFRVYFHVHGPL
jgi:hypothetical protein